MTTPSATDVAAVVIDASGAVKGANQVKDAAKTVSQAGETVTMTNRKLADSLKAQEKFLDRLRARYDPLFAVTKKFGQEQARLQGIIDRGGDFSVRAAAELEALKESYLTTAAAIDPLAAKLNALKMRFDPLFAAEQRYQTELSAAAEAFKIGAISAEQYQKALARIDESLSPAAAAAREQAEAMARLQSQFGSLEAQLSPAIAAQLRYEQAVQTVDQALLAGAISVERYQQAMAQVEASLSPAAAQAREQAEAMARLQSQFGSLEAQLSPAIAAQARYEQAVQTVDQALLAGAISVERYQQAMAQVEASLSPAAAQAREQAAALERVRLSLDDGYGAQRAYAQAEETLSAALARGALSVEEHGFLLGVAQQRYQGLVTATRDGERAITGSGAAISQAGYQIGDFAVQVAGGQSALLALTQQGTQVISSFGPWGPVLGAAVAVLGGLAYGLSQASTNAAAAGSDFGKFAAVVGAETSVIGAVITSAWSGMQDLFATLTAATPELAAGIGIVSTALTAAFMPAIAGATAKVIELTIAMAANPIGAIAVAITASIAALVAFRDETITIGDTTIRIGTVFTATWETIKQGALMVWAVIKNWSGFLFDFYSNYVSIVASATGAVSHFLTGNLTASKASLAELGQAQEKIAASTAEHWANATDSIGASWDKTKAQWQGDALSKAPRSMADAMREVKTSITDTEGALSSFLKRVGEADDAAVVFQNIAEKMRLIEGTKLTGEAVDAFATGLLSQKEFDATYDAIQRTISGYDRRQRAEVELTREIETQTQARTDASEKEASARTAASEAMTKAADLEREAAKQRAGAEAAADEAITTLRERATQAAQEQAAQSTALADAEAEAATRIAEINQGLAQSRDRLQDAYSDYADSTKDISASLVKAEDTCATALKSSHTDVLRAVKTYADKMKSIRASLVKAEESYTDRMRALQQERESSYQSTTEQLRALRRKGMSDAMAEADATAEAAEHIMAAQALLQQGKISQAQAEADKATSLATNLDDVKQAIALTEQAAQVLNGIADATYKEGSDQATADLQAAKLDAIAQEQAAVSALADTRAKAATAEREALAELKEARAQAITDQQEALLKMQAAQVEAFVSERRAASQTLSVQQALASKQGEVAGQSQQMAENSRKAAEDNIKAQKEIAEAQNEAQKALSEGDKNRADESAKAIENAAKRLSSEKDLKDAVSSARDIIAKSLETEAQKQKDLAKEQAEVAKKYGEQKAAADTLLQVLKDIAAQYGVMKETAQETALKTVSSFVDTFEAVGNTHAQMALKVAAVYDRLEGATKASAARIKGWLTSIAGMSAGGSLSINVALPGFATGGLVKKAFSEAGAAFAGGGLISGPGTGTSDSILAMVDGTRPILVSNGEGIITADAISHYGESIIPLINNKLLALSQAPPPRFAAGGLVSLPAPTVALSQPVAALASAPAAGDTYNITLTVQGSPDPRALFDAITAEAKRRKARGLV